jgi:hypothetical protein
MECSDRWSSIAAIVAAGTPFAMNTSLRLRILAAKYLPKRTLNNIEVNICVVNTLILIVTEMLNYKALAAIDCTCNRHTGFPAAPSEAREER